MGSFQGKIKRVACFTQEQQRAYEHLSEKQRRYVDFRGKGYNKTDSYRMAGFSARVSGQGAYLMEKRNKTVVELIETILSVKKATQINDSESRLNQTIDALANQKTAEDMLEKIEGADGETAQRIKFYRDIINGKIKSVKKTTKKNALGAVVETKIEEYNDIESRMKARKELDRILGLNEMPSLDSLQMGDITINIVDTSQTEELEDDRNKVVLDIDKVETIDGEEVLVTKEAEEVESGKEKPKVTVEKTEA